MNPTLPTISAAPTMNFRPARIRNSGGSDLAIYARKRRHVVRSLTLALPGARPRQGCTDRPLPTPEQRLPGRPAQPWLEPGKAPVGEKLVGAFPDAGGQAGQARCTDCGGLDQVG